MSLILCTGVDLLVCSSLRLDLPLVSIENNVSYPSFSENHCEYPPVSFISMSFLPLH